LFLKEIDPMNFLFDDHNFHMADVASLAASIGVTPREWDILEWVARGKTNKEVGKILSISSRTASKHLENIYTKFGVNSRTEAVVHFLQLIQAQLRVRVSERTGTAG